MSDVTPWIEHLSNPLVLVGFAVFTLAGLVKLFKPEKLNGKETAGLFHKGLNFVFVLGLLIVIGGFANSFVEKLQTAEAAKPIPTPPAPPVVKQRITGSNGVNGEAGRDVNINLGGGTLSHQTNNTPPATPAPPVADVDQQIDGSNGVNGQGGRDTNIQTPGK